MAETSYDAKDITVLEGLEPVRLRPGMYIGSTGARGLHHLVYEVVDNSVDEALAGRNERIEVRLHPDNSVTVRDWGSGIPVDVMEDQGLPALTVVLTKLHAGGKFGGEGYKVSGGLHGVGVSVVNALLRVARRRGRRDGKVYRQEFARGEPTTEVEEVGVGRKGETGTTISFLPDSEVFEETRARRADAHAALPRDRVPHRGPPHRLRRRARGRGDAGVLLRGRDQGLRRLRQRDEGPRPQAHRLLRGRERRGPVEVAMQWNTSYVESVFSFANNINTHEGGTHLSGLQGGADRDAEPVRPRQGAS